MENSKKIQPWSVWKIFAVGVVIKVVFVIVSFISSSRKIEISPMNIVNNGIMIVFFLIVWLVFCKANRNLKTGKKMSEDLWNASDRIDKYKNQYGIDGMLERLEKEELFQDSPKKLQGAYKEFKERSRQLEGEGSSIKANISDYINYDFVEDAVNSHFMSQIPGIMVGLGILGTFVGLSVGLSSFSIGTDVKEMMTAIQPLMNGIKTAFHTSICGMIYSLLFNFTYRKDLFALQQSVDKFIDCYENNVVLSTSNGSATTAVFYQEQMVSLLREQNDQLEEMRKSIISGLNDSSVYMIEYLSEQMNAAIVPELQNVSHTLSSCTEEAARGQNEKLEEMRKSIISGLNDSSADMVERLSPSVSK